MYYRWKEIIRGVEACLWRRIKKIWDIRSGIIRECEIAGEVNRGDEECEYRVRKAIAWEHSEWR